MTEDEKPAIELGEPTDVTVDPEALQAQEAEEPDAESPTGSAARYEDDDAKGGTGGLNAGGAG